MVHLHKVYVKHHANQSDEYSAGQNSCVLCEEENGVSQKPNTAGVHQHFAYGHFRGADCELSAKFGVTLAVQRYGFATDVKERFIFHHERNKKTENRRNDNVSELSRLA